MRPSPFLLALAFTVASAAEHADPPAPLPGGGGGSLARRLIGRQRPIEDERLNLRLVPPAGFEAWSDGVRLNPSLAIACIDRQRTIYLGAAGGAVGRSGGADTAAMAAVQMRNLRQAQPACAFSEPAALAGAEGWVGFTQHGPVDGVLLHFAHAIRLHQGFLHHLMAWGPQERAAEIDAALTRAATGSAVLDPARAAADGPAAGGDDAALGVRIAFPEDGWYLQPAGSDPAEAHFARIYARLDQRWLAIADLDCGGLQPPTVQEAVLTLQRLTGSQHQEAVVSGSGAGSEAVWRLGPAEDAPVFVARVLVGEGRVLMAVGRAEDAREASVARLRAVVSGVAPLPGAAPARRLPDPVAAALAAQVGLTAFASGRLDRAAEWFAHAVALSPRSDDIRRGLLHVLALAGREHDLLAAARAAREVRPDDIEYAAHLARALAGTGDAGAAADAYVAVFAAGFRDTEHLARYLAALRASGRADRIRAALEAYLAVGMDEAVLVALADLHAEEGRVEAALATLDRGAPSPVIAFARARLLRQVGRGEEALALYRREGARQGPGADLDIAIGETLLELDRLEESLAAFREAHRIAPHDPRGRQYIALVQRLLGRGDTLEMLADLEPVPLPDGLRRGASPGPAAGAHAIVLHLSTAIRWRPGEEHIRTDRRRVRVLDHAGVEQYATLQYAFDPVLDDIAVGRLAVLGPDGALLAEGQPQDWYCVDRGDSAVTGGERVAMLPVPALAPGCEIDFEVTLRRRGSPRRFPFLSWQVFGPSPVAEASLAIDAPEGSLVHGGTGVEVPRVPGDGLRFRVQDHPALRFEPLMDLVPCVPGIAVADAGDTWAALAAAYRRDIAAHLEPTEPAIAHAARLVAELGVRPPDEAVIVRLAAEVQGMAYRASSFGPRGRMPAPAARTLADRSGDCKGLSVLLLQMLRARGIAADLALVSSSELFCAGTPSLEQFDHLVVRLADGRFLDATGRQRPLTAQPPLGLERRMALVLAAEGAELVRIPDQPPHASTVHRTGRIELHEDGSERLRERYEFRGPYATRLREGLVGLADHERERAAQELVGVAMAPIEHLAVELPAGEAALAVTVTWRREQGLQAVRGLLVGRLPAPWEGRHYHQAASPGRTLPFRLELAVDGTAQLQVVPPEGWRFTDLPPALEAWDDGWHAFRRRTTVEADGILVVETSILPRAGAFPPAAYEGFRASAARVLRGTSPALVLAR